MARGRTKQQKEEVKDIAIEEILTGKPVVDVKIEEKKEERKQILHAVSKSVELKVMEGSFEEVLKYNGWRLVRADLQGRYFIVKNTGDTLAHWIYKDGILSANVDVCIDTRKSKFKIEGKTLYVV